MKAMGGGINYEKKKNGPRIQFSFGNTDQLSN